MGNEFDKKYDIRFARYDEIDNLMKFIDIYWKSGHILSVDRKLFEYEFLEDDRVNIIMAIDREKNTIEAIFGMLYCSHTNDLEKRDIWGSLWKVVDDHDNMPMLGIEIARRVYTMTRCRMHIGSGANPKTTIPLRKLIFHDKTGKMKQYYKLNPEYTNNYKVCIINNYEKINDYENGEICLGGNFAVKEIYSMEEFKKEINIEKVDVYPYKDNWYINKRYFNHPYYTYRLFCLQENNETKAIMIGRELSVEDRKIFRVIDYIGDHQILRNSKSFLELLLKENNYEYMDFFEYGINDDIMIESGMTVREDNDENIIPNYFEPFLQENVDIWVHYKYEGTTFFKGDCDQDRPNIARI